MCGVCVRCVCVCVCDVSVCVILQQGVADVKQHRWFKGVDWDAVLQRKLVVSL